MVIGSILIFSIIPGLNSLKDLDKTDYFIINGQESIGSAYEVSKLLNTMNATNVEKTVLVGSPEQILNYQGQEGFSNVDANNDEIVSIANKYDKRFYAFCAVDPDDPQKLTKLQDCLADGGDGIKLYTGHSHFYTDPLDDEKMLEIYEYAQDENVPVIMHVNIAYYLDEFENVMTLYPDMKVVCSHFCLSSKNIPQLTELLENYENLFVDIGFGYKAYLIEGLERISENIDVYKELFAYYGDRFVFGTTAVASSDSEKTEECLTEIYQAYRNLLEREVYTTTYIEGELNGLALPDETLKKVYFQNWEEFMK